MFIAIDVSENLTFKTGPPEDGVDDRRNPSEYKLKSVISCIIYGELKVGLVNTDYYEHNARCVK